MQIPPPKQNNLHHTHIQPPTLRKFHHEISSFSHRAEDAATSLYAISYYCSSLFGSGALQRDIASRLIGVAGALTFLGSFVDDDQHVTPLLSIRDLETVSENVGACEVLVVRIREAMKRLEEFLGYEKGTVGIPAKFNAFNKGEEGEALGVLKRCCDVVIKATMIARREVLLRRRALYDTEERELEHYQHPRLQTALAYLEMFPGAAKGSKTKIPAPATEDGVPPEAQPFLPLPFSLCPLPQDNAAFKTPARFICGNFVGSDTVRRPDVMTEAIENPDGGDDDTPKSTRQVTHISETIHEGSSIDKSTATTTRSKAIDNMMTRVSRFSLQPHQDLEIYILRPHTEMSSFGFTLNLKAEKLHLDRESILAHMKDNQKHTSALDIHPDQLCLVTSHTNLRGGRLVSMQYAKAMNISTPMGVLNMQPLVFVIQVEKQKKGETHNPPPANHSPFSVGLRGPLFTKPAFNTTYANRTSYLVESGEYPLDSVQAYQSITTLPPYQKQSFEELRLSDYASGAVDEYGRASTLLGGIHGLFGAQGPSKSAQSPVRAGPFGTPDTREDTTVGGTYYHPHGCVKADTTQSIDWLPPCCVSRIRGNSEGTSTTQPGPFSSIGFGQASKKPIRGAAIPSGPTCSLLNTDSSFFNSKSNATSGAVGHSALSKPVSNLFGGTQSQSSLLSARSAANTGGGLFASAPESSSGSLFGQPQQNVRSDAPLGAQASTASGGLFGHGARPTLFGGGDGNASTSLFGNTARAQFSPGGSGKRGTGGRSGLPKVRNELGHISVCGADDPHV